MRVFDDVLSEIFRRGRHFELNVVSGDILYGILIKDNGGFFRLEGDRTIVIACEVEDITHILALFLIDVLETFCDRVFFIVAVYDGFRHIVFYMNVSANGAFLPLFADFIGIRHEMPFSEGMRDLIQFFRTTVEGVADMPMVNVVISPFGSTVLMDMFCKDLSFFQFLVASNAIQVAGITVGIDRDGQSVPDLRANVIVRIDGNLKICCICIMIMGQQILIDFIDDSMSVNDFFQVRIHVIRRAVFLDIFPIPVIHSRVQLILVFVVSVGFVIEKIGEVNGQFVFGLFVVDISYESQSGAVEHFDILIHVNVEQTPAFRTLVMRRRALFDTSGFDRFDVDERMVGLGVEFRFFRTADFARSYEASSERASGKGFIIRPRMLAGDLESMAYLARSVSVLVIVEPDRIFIDKFAFHTFNAMHFLSVDHVGDVIRPFVQIHKVVDDPFYVRLSERFAETLTAVLAFIMRGERVLALRAIVLHFVHKNDIVEFVKRGRDIIDLRAVFFQSAYGTCKMLVGIPLTPMRVRLFPIMVDVVVSAGRIEGDLQDHACIGRIFAGRSYLESG